MSSGDLQSAWLALACTVTCCCSGADVPLRLLHIDQADHYNILTSGHDAWNKVYVTFCMHLLSPIVCNIMGTHITYGTVGFRVQHESAQKALKPRKYRG